MQIILREVRRKRAVEKISSLIEILFEYADVTKYLYEFEIFPEIKFVLPQNFRTIIDEKIGDLERIMTNLSVF